MPIQTDTYQAKLHRADLRVTPARIGVLTALTNSPMPLTVNDVMAYLAKHKIKADKATVFRIINSFTQKGIATSVQLNEGRLRFESSAKGDHHHFVCEQCGSITDISDCQVTKLTQEIQKKKGLVIHRHSLEFFGLCSNCQE